MVEGGNGRGIVGQGVRGGREGGNALMRTQSEEVGKYSLMHSREADSENVSMSMSKRGGGKIRQGRGGGQGVKGGEIGTPAQPLGNPPYSSAGNHMEALQPQVVGVTGNAAGYDDDAASVSSRSSAASTTKALPPPHRDPASRQVRKTVSSTTASLAAINLNDGRPMTGQVHSGGGGGRRKGGGTGQMRASQSAKSAGDPTTIFGLPAGHAPAPLQPSKGIQSSSSGTMATSNPTNNQGGWSSSPTLRIGSSHSVSLAPAGSRALRRDVSLDSSTSSHSGRGRISKSGSRESLSGAGAGSNKSGQSKESKVRRAGEKPIVRAQSYVPQSTSASPERLKHKASGSSSPTSQLDGQAGGQKESLRKSSREVSLSPLHMRNGEEDEGEGREEEMEMQAIFYKSKGNRFVWWMHVRGFAQSW